MEDNSLADKDINESRTDDIVIIVEKIENNTSESRDKDYSPLNENSSDNIYSDESMSTEQRVERQRANSMSYNRRRRATYSALSPENAPVILNFKNLIVSTKTVPPKILINNVSGSIAGGFWAIMGSSGGGKTTLLSTLSLRLDTRQIDISGDYTLNGRPYEKNTLKAMSAYVMQDDILHAELTVDETLYFASKLRLPSEFTDQQRQDRIEQVIDMMNIHSCRKVIVGDSRRKGISGGERKRLCVAIELLSKPQLLFLDEPTSGLDSSTALVLCEALKEITELGEATVICTIHQPQQKIFNLFDNLLLMKKGTIVYQGSCAKSFYFMESIGKPCPFDVNPADHLIDILTPVGEEQEDILSNESTKQKLPIDLAMGMDKNFAFERDTVNWMQQFLILNQRNLQQYWRRKDIIFLNFVSTCGIACFIGGGIWYQQQNSTKAYKTLPPSLFFGCVTQGIFASLQCVNSFPGERAIMLRERSAGTYYVSSYYLAKTTSDMLTNLWAPIVFTCIAYPMLGYQNVASKFFIYMAFMILDNMAAVSIAVAVSCLCVSVERSTVLLSFFFEFCRLYSGFFTSPAQLESFPNWKWADAISYIKYVYVGVALNQLTDLNLQCTQAQITSNICVSSGQTIIDANGYDQYSISFCAGILLLYIAIVRLLGYLALRFIRV